MPQVVPIHWNIKGEIDGYANKGMLLLLPILLPLLVYIIFLIIPMIDPKNKLSQMGNKFQNIKVLVTVFMSVLALFIIYSAKSQSLTNPNYVILGIGVLFIILGNYFKTIKPNYFLGIRTPWTLEDETVWKETHMAGIMWLYRRTDNSFCKSGFGQTTEFNCISNNNRSNNDCSYIVFISTIQEGNKSRIE